jgi:hypothetical protein
MTHLAVAITRDLLEAVLEELVSNAVSARSLQAPVETSSCNVIAVWGPAEDIPDLRLPSKAAVFVSGRLRGPVSGLLVHLCVVGWPCSCGTCRGPESFCFKASGRAMDGFAGVPVDWKS